MKTCANLFVILVFNLCKDAEVGKHQEKNKLSGHQKKTMDFIFRTQNEAQIVGMVKS